jgi:hypothetical protein
MVGTLTDNGILSPETAEFYRQSLRQLRESGIPFLVGGAYALGHFTGIVRHTKDIDIFIRPDDCPAVLEMFARNGCQTELTFPHWLGKAFCGGEFVDVIFSSGNGVAQVDDLWFKYAPAGDVLGEKVRICPAEETIWSKGFILERERYDGADVNHLLRAVGPTLDWRRLLWRYGPNWRVLLSHLVLFGFVYPAERTRVPQWVMDELLRRLQTELTTPAPDKKLCQGTLVSREQYLIDVEQWGYKDARLEPRGNMSAEDIQQWTDAIDEKK